MNFFSILGILITLVESRMLRRQNIGISDISTIPLVTAISGGNDGGGVIGFRVAAIPQPLGNTAPPGMTSPSPYKTFQASALGNFHMNWTPDPNAFVFDSSDIQHLSPVMMGSNFRILMTAQPQYPTSMVATR